jgi:hypothetical protein
MKSFKSFISEEVLPTANVENGNFDLENDSVRAEVNAILAGICSHSHVTPYITLRKVSKALAYFSIILPKRTFLEGDKGVEVYEIKQFGEKVGMTDQGEFVREVPVQYHLFFQYVQVMGRFMVTAKVVDKAELDKMLDTAEMTMKECWDKATKSEREAIKEPIHTDGNNGSPSTKLAMDTSERTKDKKLANGKLDKEWPAVVKEEESLDEGMAPIKKSYAMRKLKKKVSTQVKQGLGVGKEKTSTVLVTNKGDPKAATGGGVHRIPRDKYDPSKHNMASE